MMCHCGAFVEWRQHINMPYRRCPSCGRCELSDALKAVGARERQEDKDWLDLFSDTVHNDSAADTGLARE